MDLVMLMHGPQAGLFSAVLTAFVLDSKQDLKPSPADETVYYLQQHSTILYQISVQLSSIAPQVSIPSTQPPPFPPFSPLASDVHINVFWFMALAFSLIAALLAILVQQWVRNYMHVFQRYSDPLKSARLRQYLFEGCDGWYMPMVAEAVPGFLHVSLFLFFGGLGNLLLNTNTTVGISTIIPIGISGLLYILMTFVPIMYPQSPYQNSFSSALWYLFQKLRGWKFRDRGPDGEMKSMSTNMAQSQMQLAMEETEARKGRDERAIRWLIDNMTEDAEMEKFLTAIPGSFNTDWGAEVWKRVGKYKPDEYDDRSQNEPPANSLMVTTFSAVQVTPPVDQPSSTGNIHSAFRPISHLARKLTSHYPPINGTILSPIPSPSDIHPHSPTAHIHGNIVREFSERVARSLEICKNPGLIAKEELRRKRAREGIETTASLVFCANAKPAWFGDIVKLLGDMGASEKIRESSLAGTDQFFVMHWTCLSLVALRQVLEDNGTVRSCAKQTVEWFADEDDTGKKKALATALKIDETLQKASYCLNGLYYRLPATDDLTDKVKGILRGCESEIEELEKIIGDTDRLKRVDQLISWTKSTISDYSWQITYQIPGIFDDLAQELDHLGDFVQLYRDHHKMPFVLPGEILKNMCSPAPMLRDILEGQGDAEAYNKLRKNLEEVRGVYSWQGNEIRRQLWRLQDICEGGGLGFTVELFFFALSQLLSTSSTKESHSALYTGAFQAITSNWSRHKHSLGTQNLLLDIALSRWEFDRCYPDYIVDEFTELLGNIFEGQTDTRIDEARQQVESFPQYVPEAFRDRVLGVITRA